MNTSLYGKIATLIFIIIFLIDMNTDYLKVTNMKKLKMNKIVFVLIALFVLFVIEYIEDFITYNYLDDYLKKDEPPSPDCYQNSYYDAILAGVPEELVFRLLIFNVILIKYFKLGLTKSILISSVIFGLTHINQYISFGVNIYNTMGVIIQAIFGGIIFAYIYANTNLTTVIVVHFLIDYIDFMFLRCNKSLYKKMLFIQ
jgi:hypothetical protein